MYVADRKEYVEYQQAGVLFWLLWVVATTLGAFVGRYIEEFVLLNAMLPGAFDIVTVAAAGAIGGALIGLGQALVLLPYLKRQGAIEWIIATTLGRIATQIIFFLYADALAGLFLDNTYTTVCGLIVIRILFGGVLGLIFAFPQYLVLKQRTSRAAYWLLANAGVSMVTTYISVFTVGIFYGLVTGLVTGYVMVDILRNPTQRAEWRVREKV